MITMNSFRYVRYVLGIILWALILFSFLSFLIAEEMPKSHARWVMIHKTGIQNAASVEFIDRGSRIRMIGETNTYADVDIRNAVALMQRHPDVFYKTPHTKQDAFYLEMTNGDRVLVRKPVYDGNRFDFDHTAWKRISVNARYVKSLYRCGSPAPAVKADFTGLILKNGDQTHGTVCSLNEKAVLVEMEGLGKIPVGGLDGVNVVIFPKQKKEAPTELKKEGIHVSLISGERISGNPVSGSKESWSIQPVWRSKAIVVYPSFIRAATFPANKVFLSDMPHHVHSAKPYAGGIIPMRKDRSLFDHLLRVSGLSADKGIALHSSTRVDYPLSELKRTPVRLCGVAGIDSEAFFPGATAILQISMDGQVVHKVELKSGGNLIPIFIHIPVGTKLMSIETDYGRLGSVSDNVDLLWGSLIYADK